MSLRFRRRIRIFPGIYLNIGKTGISASIGQRGANLNFGKRGVFLNTGIPGTGLSYRTRIPGQKGEVPPSRGKPSGALGIIPQDSEETIRVNVPPPLHDAPAKSSTANINTGDAFLAVLAQIDQAREQRKNLLKQIDQTAAQNFFCKKGSGL
jgi:hypothetical protein